VAGGGIGAAVQVVVEIAVAAGRDRGGGDGPVGSEGEGQPGALEREDAVEVGGIEEVALGGAGAPHRLLVGGEEAGPLGGAGLRPRHDLNLVAAAAVPVDLVAVAGALLARQAGVGDLDEVALRGTGERRRIVERVAGGGAGPARCGEM